MEEFYLNWHGVMQLSKWTQIALVLSESQDELRQFQIAFPNAFRAVRKPSETGAVKLSALMRAKAEEMETSGSEMCLLWLDLFTDLCSVAEQCGITAEAIVKFAEFNGTPVPEELRAQIVGQRIYPAFPVQYGGRTYVVLGICINPKFGEAMKDNIPDLSLVPLELIDVDH